MAPPPPTDGSDSSGGSRTAALSPVDDEQAKAKLDDTELNIGSPRALQKVELDLDDAPFLEEEVDAAPVVEEIPTAPTPQELEEPFELPIWKNKKVLGGAGILLVFLGLAVWWFFLRTKEAPPPPPPPPPIEEAPKPEEPAAPPVPPAAYFSMEPFVVEKTDAKGGTKILTLKIKLVYKEDPQLAQELQSKSLALRDGLYYNLKNKSFGNLTDKKSVDQLREELRGVVNNYLNTGQVDQVLFEELLVK
jgi:flagellar FliL protein